MIFIHTTIYHKYCEHRECTKPEGCFICLFSHILYCYRSKEDSKVGNCLTDEALIYDTQEYNQNIGTHPGQLTNPNDQCKAILGPSSYYGWVSSFIKQYID